MANKRNVTAGLGWYSAEQWAEYQRIMVDDAAETYEQWLENALRLEQNLKKQGVDVVRVPVDVGEFDFWCTVNKRPRDSQSRSAYVSERLGKR